MAETMISMHHLAKRFGKQEVLSDINFDVQKGEIVGLIGPSGAGKSTVIKAILGMIAVDRGKATVFDTQMPNRELLARIGYMAQTDALYDTLTARENLVFYGKMKGLDKAVLAHDVEHVAMVVDLLSDLDKRVINFSGGMQRRLSLAIALLGTPDLLILDEPTVGIDPALRQKIWRELHQIRDAGRSILITTHVMDEGELVDQVALLMAGKVMAFNPPEILKAQYQVDSIESVFLKAEGVQL
ncbi:ABC transporter ATP-binding protein [Latilactobacillus sakei]|uniref:ABC transporter ATP-binding protein n=1 Tax=Latilactobacillus sakei TaxID=1599 RepID=UPI000DC642C2|nr:ABC transporter ATP-binding protein [Latilactobacillus sakei]SPS07087.1 putative ABC transporter ATP-binding protein YbhF [Latilactobacillus sakei]